MEGGTLICTPLQRKIIMINLCKDKDCPNCKVVEDLERQLDALKIRLHVEVKEAEERGVKKAQAAARADAHYERWGPS